jgi:hypothetical protein
MRGTRLPCNGVLIFVGTGPASPKPSDQLRNPCVLFFELVTFVSETRIRAYSASLTAGTGRTRMAKTPESTKAAPLDPTELKGRRLGRVLTKLKKVTREQVHEALQPGRSGRHADGLHRRGDHPQRGHRGPARRDGEHLPGRAPRVRRRIAIHHNRDEEPGQLPGGGRLAAADGLQGGGGRLTGGRDRQGAVGPLRRPGHVNGHDHGRAGGVGRAGGAGRTGGVDRP